MKSFNEIKDRVILESATIREALDKLDNCAGGALFVVDCDNLLKGTLTDGDIRRAFLKNVGTGAEVRKAMRSDPNVAHIDSQEDERFKFMLNNEITWLPVIDSCGRLLGAETTDAPDTGKYLDNEAVIMCGGLGTRLGPLTRACPKPMLKVRGVPILERILLNLRAGGVRRFYFATNYLREQIENYFGEGEKWDVSIEYLKENQRMGTGGALSLLPRRPRFPLIIMNGDLLTDFNINHILNFHISTGAIATMGIVEYQYKNPYGVIRYKDITLLEIEEKPVQSCFINSGIYIINPEFLDDVPPDTFVDMPTLLLRQKASGRPVHVYPIYENWLDIGRQADFEQAQNLHY